MAAIVAATLFGGFVGYQVGSVSGSAGAWSELKNLGSTAAQAAPEQGTYSRKVISDCLDGIPRDPSVDCEAVLASLPEPKTSYDMAIASPRTIGTNCPSPTTREAGTGNCVLTDDVVLTQALWLSSGTTLDCKGHRMTPSVDGQSSRASVPWGPDFGPSVPSVPNTAVLLAGDTSGVTVKNCTIENFDFGVVIANSKVPPTAKSASRNLITKNTLNNRYRGVLIVASDRNEIVDNDIHSFSYASGGVGIFHDSDDNLVKGNTYVGPSVDSWNPGPVFPGGPDERGEMQWTGEAVKVIGPVASYSFRVGDKLLVGAMSRGNAAERNIIDGNDVDIPNRAANGIVTDGLTHGTVISGNTVRRVSDAILLVGHYGDRGHGSDYWSKDTRVEGNTILGPADSGLLVAANRGSILRGNKIQHALWTGMFLVFQEDVTVTGNLVKDSGLGVFLLEMLDGAKVWGNDFVDNELGVDGFGSAPFELSSEGKGNYWGHSEPPAFRATDTSDPSLFNDSHASLVPVSGLLDD